MTNTKVMILNELTKLTNDYHAVMLRRAALNVGVKHLKTQECHEVLNAFTKEHPEFKIYQLADNPTASLFCSAFVSDNESLPVADEARV